MSRLQVAIDQIAFARNYTLRLLDCLDADQWFQIPTSGVSHIGWQVGHIAIAEYRLALWRIRGQQVQDEGLFAPQFMDLFGVNSVPVADPTKYPAPSAIRTALDRVHERVLRELPGFNDADLDQPVVHPHDVAKTKLKALMWCANHEMLHAGQIGLLRRQLGFPPMQ
jgi:uncharacterized damage-inducible protein DinB